MPYHHTPFLKTANIRNVDEAPLLHTAFFSSLCVSMHFRQTKTLICCLWAADSSHDRVRRRLRSLPALPDLCLRCVRLRSRGSPKASLDAGFVADFIGDVREIGIFGDVLLQIVDLTVPNASVFADDAG
jgi:hypothetical protein